MLRTYSNPVESVLITRKMLEWANTYVRRAMAGADLSRIRSRRGRERSIKTHKLVCAAFTVVYGRHEEWKAKHEKVNIWPPFVDFKEKGKKVRIVGVSAGTTGKWARFGPRLSGRVAEKDFSRGHHYYVLASWYPPYVDLVGWQTAEDLRPNRERWYYEMHEKMCRPMSELPGFEKAS